MQHRSENRNVGFALDDRAKAVPPPAIRISSEGAVNVDAKTVVANVGDCVDRAPTQGAFACLLTGTIVNTHDFLSDAKRHRSPPALVVVMVSRGEVATPPSLAASLVIRALVREGTNWWAFTPRELIDSKVALSEISFFTGGRPMSTDLLQWLAIAILFAGVGLIFWDAWRDRV
jgi:hypothetical protein